jgi:hypothetical protein
MSGLAAAQDGLVAKTAEIGAAGRAFSLHSPTYREAYQKILDLHEQVAITIGELDAQASSIHPKTAAEEIEGVKTGANLVYQAVIGTNTGSLRNSLLYVQNELAKLLNEMRQSYITYVSTDQASAADLKGAATTL